MDERELNEAIPNKELVDKFVKKIIRYSDEDRAKITAAAIFAAQKHGISEIFGKEVGQMVQAVTKISRITDEKSIQEAETIKKMFFAMSKDLRVILIKLADKLHNMRTIQGLSPERKRAFANDCLEIFAPIADSLGMSTI